MGDDKISNLITRRFDKISDPAAHEPAAALKAALEWVESTEEKPDHIIVLTGRTHKDGGSTTRFFQAGSYTYHGQQGLCYEGMHRLREDG